MPEISLALVLEIVAGVLKFPGEVVKLIRILSKTPTEKHDDILKAAAEEAQKFQDTGRPTWEK